MSFTHRLFDDKAQLYASARPRYPAAVYQFLVDQSHAQERVWDAATGNGQAAIDLSHYYAEVFASDISFTQLQAATSQPQVAYVRQASEACACRADSFDAVCVAQALHWFDYAHFWPEVKRVLKPGGIFAAWGYTWLSISPEIDACLEQTLLRAIEPYWASENRLLWNHYRDVPFPFQKLNPPAIEFRMAWNITALFAYLHSWSATRRCMAAEGELFFETAYLQVARLWGEPQQVRQVNFDFCFLAGRNDAQSI